MNDRAGNIAKTVSLGRMRSSAPATASVQLRPAYGADSKRTAAPQLRNQPKLVQAKMDAVTQSRFSHCATGGVVQANVVGGNHALQARLNLWNTSLARGANESAAQDGA